MHAHIAAGIAKGQDRLASDLPNDLQHLVHLQVLDQQVIRTNNAVITGKDIVQAVCISLVNSLHRHIHADDLLIRDIQYSFNKGPADETVASAADKDLKVIVLQVFHHFDHRNVKGVCIGHAFKPVRVTHQAVGHKIRKL